MTFLLAPLCKRVVGVDGDAKRVEAAKQRAKRLGIANAEFHVGDLERDGYGKLVPGGAELIVAHLFLSKPMMQHVHEALVPGGAFLFTGFGPRQWQEAGGSSFAHREEEVRGWLEQAHLRVEALEVEDTKVRFRELSDARAYLGEDRVKQWLKDGRWDKLVAGFPKQRGLTESRLTGLARR
ncbi:MAG: methyltransferase domain-containing protein [Halobacteriales archaeon]|nr:methyltransferase domain-containing protein [Halobacteriales archaeon]